MTLAEVLWAKGSPLEEEEIWALLYLSTMQLLEDLHKGEVKSIFLEFLLLEINSSVIIILLSLVFCLFVCGGGVETKNTNGTNSILLIKVRNLSVLLALHADCSIYIRGLHTVSVLVLVSFPN